MSDTLTPVDRKRLGSWYTPDELVDRVLSGVLDDEWWPPAGRPRRVIDPACGDGRFLAAVRDRARAAGQTVELVGLDIDPAACLAARRAVPEADIIEADALDESSAVSGRFDLVVGNPPFLSQMASETARGGSSRWGGGPYADVAVEFLGLAADLVVPDGGRVAFVLPQSVLAARDAGPIRELYDRRAQMVWTWWSPERVFDAEVHTCALAFEFGSCAEPRRGWSHVITGRVAVPDLAELGGSGCLGDLAWLNANFRDEYYALVPAVGDHDCGPPLVTSGAIDPGRLMWGDRAVRFAKQKWRAPRVDLDLLDERMQEWARRRLVPKVLVANQTSIIEAVCDAEADLLPGVPVIGIYPHDRLDVWAIAAVLTSPVASAWAWHHRAGTGLSATAVRLSPALLGQLPFPTPSTHLDAAVRALRVGDLAACGHAVNHAYGLGGRADLYEWWWASVRRIEARR